MTDKEPAKTGTESKAPTKDSRVVLRTVGPKDRFDLSGSGLGVIDYAGKSFTLQEADEVRILAMKYGVKLIAVTKEA